jgi:hypothetical protein
MSDKFVVLLVSATDEKKKKSDVIRVYITTSTNIARTEQQHNRVDDTSCHDPKTKCGAPHWKAQLVFGPFESGSTRMCDLWKNELIPLKLKNGKITSMKQLYDVFQKGFTVHKDLDVKGFVNH